MLVMRTRSEQILAVPESGLLLRIEARRRGLGPLESRLTCLGRRGVRCGNAVDGCEGGGGRQESTAPYKAGMHLVGSQVEANSRSRPPFRSAIAMRSDSAHASRSVQFIRRCHFAQPLP